MILERLILGALVTIAVLALLWGAFGPTKFGPCDRNGLPDKHGSYVCRKP